MWRGRRPALQVPQRRIETALNRLTPGLSTAIDLELAFALEFRLYQELLGRSAVARKGLHSAREQTFVIAGGWLPFPKGGHSGNANIV